VTRRATPAFNLEAGAPRESRTKLKFMAGDHVLIWWRVITIN
jgi:hypothetical protein